MKNQSVRVTIGSNQGGEKQVLTDKKTPKANRPHIQQRTHLATVKPNELRPTTTTRVFSSKTAPQEPVSLLARCINYVSKNKAIAWGVSSNAFHKRASGNSNTWMHLLISIAAAILVGTVMGFSILTLFFSDNPVLSSRSMDSHLSNVSVVQPVSTLKKSTLMLPEMNTVFIQGGMFADYQRANQKLKEYRKMGIRAVMTDKSPYRIYLGMSPNRDDALRLSVLFQKKAIPVYLKESNVSGEVTLAETQKTQLGNLLEEGRDMVNALGSLSVQKIQLNTAPMSPVVIPAQLAEKEKRFEAGVNQLLPLLPSKASKEALKGMQQSLTGAVRSAVQLGNAPTQGLLLTLQEQLMAYPLSYEKLLYSLNQK